MPAVILIACLVLSSTSRAQSDEKSSNFPAWVKTAVCKKNNLIDCTLQYLNVVPPEDPSATFDIVVKPLLSTYTLQVAYHSIRAPSFRILSKPDVNTTIELPIPPVRTVRGVVLEWPNSYVTGVFRSDGFYGQARNVDTGGYLEVMPADVIGMPSNLYVVFNETQMLPLPELVDCTFSDVQETWNNNSASPTENTTFPMGFQCCQPCYSGDLKALISMDSNSGYWNEFGDDLILIMENTANMSSLLLERAMGLRNLLDELVVRPNPAGDPYEQVTSADQMLTMISALWRDRYAERNIALVANLHDLPFGNPGTAWPGSAGSGSCEAHHVDTLGYLAHEIGHVWGAPHCGTQACPCSNENIMSPNGHTQPYLQCSIDEMSPVVTETIIDNITSSDLFKTINLFYEETDSQPSPGSPEGMALEMFLTTPGVIASNGIRIRNDGTCGLDIELRLVGGASAFSLDSPLTKHLSLGATHLFDIRFLSSYVGHYSTTVEVMITNYEPVPLGFRIPVSIYNSPLGASPGPFAAVNTMAPSYDWNTSLNNPRFYVDWTESSNAETYQFTLNRRATPGGPILSTRPDAKKSSSVSNKFTLQKPGSFCGFTPGFWNWTIVAENENGTTTLEGPIFEVTNVGNLMNCNDG